MKPEIEILIPKQKYFSDIDDKPVQTRAGRQVRKLKDMEHKDIILKFPW